MGFGLFGKLPQKRDFISLNLPHGVLHPFESWLQSAVAASRTEIGQDWQAYYMVSPIWRFWLGEAVLGTACMGSIMPSVDQVGRYFPLAMIYHAEPGQELVPPLLDPHTGWFRMIEQRLLSVLTPDFDMDIARLLDGLQPPGRPDGPPIVASQPSAPPPSAPMPDDTPLPQTPEREAPAAVADLAYPVAEAPEPSPSLTAITAPDPIWETWPPSPAVIPPATASKDDAVPPVAADDAWMLPSLATDALARPIVAEEPPVPEAREPDPVPNEPLPPVVEGPPRPEAVAGVAPAEEIHTAAFKLGQTNIVVGSGQITDHLGRLLELDYEHACRSRGYWWCETSASGASRIHAAPGLPDPYLYSRMLMWNGRN